MLILDFCDEYGSAKANRREPKSCLNQVFNFKLGALLIMSVIAWYRQVSCNCVFQWSWHTSVQFNTDFNGTSNEAFIDGNTTWLKANEFNIALIKAD